MDTTAAVLLVLVARVRETEEKVALGLVYLQNYHGGERVSETSPEFRDMLSSDAVFKAARNTYVKLVEMLRVLHESECKRGMPRVRLFDYPIRNNDGTQSSQQQLFDRLPTSTIQEQRNAWLFLTTFTERYAPLTAESREAFNLANIPLAPLADVLALALAYCLRGLATCLQYIYIMDIWRQNAETSHAMVHSIAEKRIQDNLLIANVLGSMELATALRRIGDAADDAIALEAAVADSRRDALSMGLHERLGSASWILGLTPDLVHRVNGLARVEPVAEFVRSLIPREAA